MLPSVYFPLTSPEVAVRSSRRTASHGTSRASSAVVDRGLEIQEGDETNNEMEKLVAINELEVDVEEESAGLLSSQSAWIGIVAIAMGVLALLVFMMPAKIKKIE